MELQIFEIYITKNVTERIKNEHRDNDLMLYSWLIAVFRREFTRLGGCTQRGLANSLS